MTRPQHLWLCSVLLLAFGLRVAQLEGSSLWSDEGNTWALIQRSYSQIATDAAADIHPPGYYWMLKAWTAGVGISAVGMRLFSAFSGLVLVALLYPLGTFGTFRLNAEDFCANDRRWTHQRRGAWLPLVAPTLAALHPPQVYYSQEARMYMLLALLSTLVLYNLMRLIESEQLGTPPSNRTVWRFFLAVLLCGAAGLWVHYSFPIVLLAAGLTYLCHWICLSRSAWRGALSADVERRSSDAARTYRYPVRYLLRFAFLYLLILLSYAPWLPTAVARVLAWPQKDDAVSWVDALRESFRFLLFGPLRNVRDPHPGWMALAALLPFLGIGALVLFRRHRSPSARYLGFALLAWLAVPLSVMLLFGLVHAQFLKFLLVAAPVWTLAVSFVLLPILRFKWIGRGLTGVGLVAYALFATQTLLGYYRDGNARDNYAGIARYIGSVERSGGEIVILNAPGQREVWRYYDPGLEVLALPAERPPDAEATVARLEEATMSVKRAYAIFWATDESDPANIVENWLNQRGFKGLDQWLGNIRFVIYHFASELQCRELDEFHTFSTDDGLTQIRLEAQCQPHFPQQTAQGEVALLALHWRPLMEIDQPYKVTVQLLDNRQQVIAQQDGVPGGGSMPTSDWIPRARVTDKHGIIIPIGTPPGTYPMIVALYNAETGERLLAGDLDFILLGEMKIVRSSAPVTTDLLPVTHRVGQRIGPVWLLGYNIHKKGFAHAPQTQIQPGEWVHMTLFWQAPAVIPSTWPEDLHFSLTIGEQRLTAPLAGGTFPTERWLPSDTIRGEFDLLYDGVSPELWLVVEDERVRLGTVP